MLLQHSTIIGSKLSFLFICDFHRNWSWYEIKLWPFEKTFRKLFINVRLNRFMSDYEKNCIQSYSQLTLLHKIILKIKFDSVIIIVLSHFWLHSKLQYSQFPKMISWAQIKENDSIKTHEQCEAVHLMTSFIGQQARALYGLNERSYNMSSFHFISAPKKCSCELFKRFISSHVFTYSHWHFN